MFSIPGFSVLGRATGIFRLLLCRLVAYERCGTERCISPPSPYYLLDANASFFFEHDWLFCFGAAHARIWWCYLLECFRRDLSVSGGASAQGTIDTTTVTVKQPQLNHQPQWRQGVPPMRDHQRIIFRKLVLASLAATLSAFGQARTSMTDVDQINALMERLSSQTRDPATVLNPTLNASVREKNLKRFSASPYELKVVPDGVASFSGDTAAVAVRVHYKARDGNLLDVGTTAHFVRVGRTWYFANYDFMTWPVGLVVALVVCLTVGVIYAATVLVLWRKLSQRRIAGARVIKVFIPFFWPVLFRQARKAPH